MCLSSYISHGANMRIANWYIQEENNEILVANEPIGVCTNITIVKNDNISFLMLRSPLNNKLLGYKLTYKKTAKFSKFITFNSVGLFYNNTITHPDKLNFDILYVDGIIRLLMYIHPNGKNDFLLVGRWREETEANEDNDDTEPTS